MMFFIQLIKFIKMGEYDMDGVGGDMIGRRGLSTIWTE